MQVQFQCLLYPDTAPLLLWLPIKEGSSLLYTIPATVSMKLWINTYLNYLTIIASSYNNFELPALIFFVCLPYWSLTLSYMWILTYCGATGRSVWTTLNHEASKSLSSRYGPGVFLYLHISVLQMALFPMESYFTLHLLYKMFFPELLI